MRILFLSILFITFENCFPAVIEIVLVKTKETALYEANAKIILDESNPLQASKDFDSVDEEYSNYLYFLYQKFNYLVLGIQKYTLNYIFEVKGIKYRKIVSCPNFWDTFIFQMYPYRNRYKLNEIFRGYEEYFYQMHNITIIRRKSLTLNPFSFGGVGMECYVLTGALNDLQEEPLLFKQEPNL